MKAKFNPLQTRLLCGLALVVLGLSSVPATAADSTFSDANWSSMGGFPGANGWVSAAVIDGAGNLYIGGYFTAVGDVIANGIAKWDGTNWSALGTGLGGPPDSDVYVSALAVSGSDLYVAGEFTTAGGISATNIAKWNGSTWSRVGSGTSGVSALVASGGNLYAGGTFTRAGGVVATNVAKWDGTTGTAGDHEKA